MTVYSDVSKARYVGNGVTKEFVVPFPYMTNNDGTAQLSVYLGDSDTPLTEGKDYYVDGVGNYNEEVGRNEGLISYEQRYESGTIIFETIPEKDTLVAIVRNVALIQGVSFIDGEKFPAQDYANGLDKLTMAVQEIKETMERAVILPPTSDEKPIEIRGNIIEAAEYAQETAEKAIKMVNDAEATIQNEVEEAKDNVAQYVEETVKPDISDFADTTMARYAQEALDNANLATQKANEALQSFENANNSANIANEAKSDAEAFVEEAKGYAESAQNSADKAKGTTITYWE